MMNLMKAQTTRTSPMITTMRKPRIPQRMISTVVRVSPSCIAIGQRERIVLNRGWQLGGDPG